MAFALGGSLAQGKTILFCSAKVALDPAAVQIYFTSLENHRADVTIVNQTHQFQAIYEMAPHFLGSYVMNITGAYNHLTSSAMLFPPFSMTRAALNRIGEGALLNPGVAHMLALEEKLIFNLNDVTSAVYSEKEKQILLGNIAEALYYWLLVHGSRGGFSDGHRLRSLLQKNEQLTLELPGETMVRQMALAAIFPVKGPPLVEIVQP